ncbi:MAG: hypothetical protein ACQERB_12635 [Promethearchaeati archaeon]
MMENQITFHYTECYEIRITEEDFKAVFRENEKFSITYNGIDYDGVSLLKIWKDILVDTLNFDEKIEKINAKITTIKDAELNDKDPFIELLRAHAPWYHGMVGEAKRFIEKLTDPSIITDPPQLGPFTIFGYIGSDINLFDFYRSIYWI